MPKERKGKINGGIFKLKVSPQARTVLVCFWFSIKNGVFVKLQNMLNPEAVSV